MIWEENGIHLRNNENMNNPIRRWTTMIVLAAFAWAALGSSSPARQAGAITDETAAASASPSTSGADLENGFVEKEETPRPPHHKKRSPWPFIVAGAVVVGVVVYFAFIRKPRYELLVATSAGVTGVPAGGRTIHKKGERIAYSFLPADGFKGLMVTLDGGAVPSAGTVVMDRDHVLRATAASMAEHTLIVRIRSGVSGSPATGTFSFREDEIVSYRYFSGEGIVRVQLDGNAVAGSGTFPMDRDHLLEAFVTPLPDLRGTWRFLLKRNAAKSAQPPLFVMFSGDKKSGTAQVIDDPRNEYWKYWWKNDGKGAYEISKGYLKFYFDNDGPGWRDFESDPIERDALSGRYSLSLGDGYPSEEGTWTASRLK